MVDYECACGVLGVYGFLVQGPWVVSSVKPDSVLSFSPNSQVLEGIQRTGGE